MKKLGILALLVISSSAFAFRGESETEIRHLSWCEKNNVMTEDSTGKVTVQWNCSELDRDCKTTEVRKPNMTIFFATCEDKK